MNIPPSEADLLDLPTYESLVAHWNEAHSSDDANLAEPSAEEAARAQAMIEAAKANPRLLN